MGKTKTRLACYDTLTGLPKLNLFKNKLNDLIDQSSNKLLVGADRFALVYLDINNFKYINETLGYKQSGEVIKCVAKHLLSKTKNSKHVARVARDKFALLFTDVQTVDELYEKIDEIISSSYYSNSSERIQYITMSAGIAIYPEHGQDVSTLMKNAETAIYSAKKSGNDIRIYSDELQKDIVCSIQMINDLQMGLEREEFMLFYQPEYNLHTKEVIGVEALVRWPHPTYGFISPEVFIPIAEKSKQIYELERWILNKALQQKQQWETEGLEHIELSINLSSKTLESEVNFQKIENIISSYQVNYSKITIEITETVIIAQVDKAIERLKRLRSYGIKIALDDFGTGYSSLTHIMMLPIDIIKIDRSFIRSLPEGTEQSAITQNILALAHDLNYRVVAEGIETEEQLEYLKKISCEGGQGYLLCKPQPSDKLREILHK